MYYRANVEVIFIPHKMSERQLIHETRPFFQTDTKYCSTWSYNTVLISVTFIIRYCVKWSCGAYYVNLNKVD